MTRYPLQGHSLGGNKKKGKITYYYLSIILFEPFAIDGIHQVVPIHPFALTSLITKGPSYLGTNMDGLANLLLTCFAVLNISCPSTNNLAFMAFP